MLFLRVHLRFPFREHLKMHKNVNKKMHITLQLMIHLTVQLRGAPEGTFDGTPKVALANLYKDTQKGACDDPLKNELEVALELHQGLHLLMQ